MSYSPCNWHCVPRWIARNVQMTAGDRTEIPSPSRCPNTHDLRSISGMFRVKRRVLDLLLGKSGRFLRVSTYIPAYPEVSPSPAGTGNTRHPSGTLWGILSLEMEQQGFPGGLQPLGL